MTEHPRHPDGDTHTRADHEPDTARRSSRGTYVFAALVLLFVVGFAVLHVTGVMGPGAH